MWWLLLIPAVLVGFFAWLWWFIKKLGDVDLRD